MKIKWKISFTFGLVIIALTTIITVFNYNATTTLVRNEKATELKNYFDLGFGILDGNYPGDWSLEGDQLYKGETLINGSNEIVDEMTRDTGVLASFFAYDIRVATNVENESGERELGSQASEAVKVQVVDNGEVFAGEAVVLGKQAISNYVPIQNAEGQVIGMLAMAVYTEEVTNHIADEMQRNIILAVILVLIGGALGNVLGHAISKGIAKLQDKMILMEDGDFSFIFDSKILDSKDEIGEISRSSKSMQKKIAGIVKDIQVESEKVKLTAKSSTENISESHMRIEDISATTEELSAGMEETSASAEEMNASTIEIEEEVARMKRRTKQGDELTEEIKERALALEKDAEESSKKAVDVYEKTNVQLRASIEKTEAIDKIKELSQAILAITSQTNLLALNASIEAARAGEHGKGFAVVAEEIRVLAEDSRSAVEKINVITEDVSDAVENVVHDSEELLSFVDNQVLKDYEALVNIGKQYNEDADKVHHVIKEIDQGAERLVETMEEIKDAVDDITKATGEGAEGTMDIANKIADIAAMTNEVLEQARDNGKSAEKLDELADFFTL